MLPMARAFPRDYVAMPLLAATAALIGNARVVSPWSGWREPAIIWAGAVGDPSAGKSPGADPVLSAVRDVQKQLGEGFDEKRRDWETLAASANATRDSWEAKVREAVKAGREPPTMPAAAVAPKEPELPRILTNDVTPERLGVLLSINPKGVLNTRDELSGWLLGLTDTAKAASAASGSKPTAAGRSRLIE